jgi:hypothetical protein
MANSIFVNNLYSFQTTLLSMMQSPLHNTLIIGLLTLIFTTIYSAPIEAKSTTFEARDIHNGLLDGGNLTFDPSDFEELDCSNQVYRESIKTPLVHRKGNPLGAPYFGLYDGTGISVHFDDLQADFKDLYFTIVHCDSYWGISDLDQSDYMTGFYENLISEYDQAFNTIIDYTHYSFDFPNDMCGVKISGNYLLIVYEDNDIEDIVFTHRFVVYEELVAIDSRVKEPTIVGDRRYNQEVDVTILHPDFPIHNPYSDLSLHILQNNRWDNMITTLEPRFVKDREIVFDYDEENNFNGGHEYRDFDLKDFDYTSVQLDSMVRYYDGWHAFLRPYEKRTFQRYSSHRDINGRLLIVNDDGPENHLDADYASVHFRLPFEHPLMGGDVYIFGQLSQYGFPESHKMTYSPSKQAYLATLFLKQGFYNYIYAFKSKNETEGDVTKVEGSHFETENEYTIFVYNYDYGLGCDRIIGAKFTNSFNR